MELELLQKLISLAKKEGLESLKYSMKDSQNNKESSIEFSFPYSKNLSHESIVSPSVNLKNTSEKNNSQFVNINKEDPSLKKITSPFVGTFYTSPSPQDPAYAKVGDQVKGQTLCIVEAMKIMNEIEAEVSGEIIEICVENESLVEYGQVLFLVRVK